MTTCAIVETSTNIVLNRIVAEVTDVAPDGCFLVDIDNFFCEIGWIYNSTINDFSPPQTTGDNP